MSCPAFSPITDPPRDHVPAVPGDRPRATNRNGSGGSFVLFVAANDCVVATLLPTNERMNSIHKSFCFPFSALVVNYL